MPQVSDRLLAALSCPSCRGALQRTPAGLACAHCPEDYHFRDGYLDLLEKRPEGLTLAQRGSEWRLSARAYRYWRGAAFSMLTGRWFPLAREAEVLLKWLQPLKAGLYLDAACATGHQGLTVARELQERSIAAEVVLLDISEAMLRQAQKRAGDLTNAVFIRADVENLPFQDGVLQAVLDGGSLNEYRHPKWALKEFSRTLAPGRPYICASEVRVDGPGWLFQRLTGRLGITFPTEDETLQWLNEADLDVRRQWRRAALMLTQSLAR